MLTACEQDQEVPSWSCSQAVSINCMTYTIAVCPVKTPDDEQRNCPKHVEFYSKNKFEKLVHLVGFVIRIRGDELCRHAWEKHWASVVEMTLTPPTSWHALVFGHLLVGYFAHFSVYYTSLKPVALFLSSCVQWRTQEFCSGGVQQIQLRTEDRENGDLGAAAL